GIRDWSVTGVQTCALPISVLDELLGNRLAAHVVRTGDADGANDRGNRTSGDRKLRPECALRRDRRFLGEEGATEGLSNVLRTAEIGRASCRERGAIAVGEG